MIKDGRPYTVESRWSDIALLTDMPYYDIDAVMDWIQENIIPAKTIYTGRTSYGLKHLQEHDTNLYLTNNQFKDAMMLSGYYPVDPDALNWHYRIALRSEMNANPSPFYLWAIQLYRDDDTPEGDFVRDMAEDRDFPKVADKRVISAYLEGCGACRKARDAFLSLWMEFERQGISVVPTHPMAHQEICGS